MENAPDSSKDVVDILAKVEYLNAENDKLKVSLESANTLNIQPKGTVFGAKLKVENNGNVATSVTFDTKKLRDKGRYTSPKDALDQALKDFLDNQNV
jgi:hypothetical protein